MADPTQSVSEPFIPSWRVPWEFGVHAVLGTSIFGIIALAAVLLSVGVVRLEKYGIDVVIILGLKAAEYAIFGVDLILFGVFLWRTARRTINRL